MKETATARALDAAFVPRNTQNKPGERHDAEPTFLAAIAGELAQLRGGTARQHISSARQLLEEAFRSMELQKRATQCRRPVHAA